VVYYLQQQRRPTQRYTSFTHFYIHCEVLPQHLTAAIKLRFERCLPRKVHGTKSRSSAVEQVSVKRTYTLQTVVSPTLIPRWPTVGRVAYTVVHLVTHDCTGGLSTCYPTADSVVDTDSTSAGVE